MLRRVIVFCSASLILSACATSGPPTGTQTGSTGNTPVIVNPGSPSQGGTSGGYGNSGQGNSGNGGHNNGHIGGGHTPPRASPPLITHPPRGGQVHNGSPSSAAAFAQLPFWASADPRPALSAFLRNCQKWARKNPGEMLSSSRPEYGQIADWNRVCASAPPAASVTADHARHFFQSNFYPLQFSAPGREKGMITGYYQPELAARRTPSSEFSEPILSVPASDRIKRLPRASLNGQSAAVIAYGRPMDVFFMQIQGSGILRFANGSRVSAGYAANNDFPYTSIGGVLIRRGELTKDKSSKRDIENWMARKGPAAARALMNENKRYIFFQEKPLVPGEGPFGSINIPLTAMGSMAVDPAHHPHGAPIWLTVNLPQFGGDYRGRETGALLIPQDVGKAIQGAARGDLYFGSGDEAGARAGVMKHLAHWTILMPIPLARQLLPRS